MGSTKQWGSKVKGPDKYVHYQYIWHLVVVRVVILGPLLLVKTVLNVVSEGVDNVFDRVHDALPTPYTTSWTDFDSLSPREKGYYERVDKLHKGAVDRMMSQTYKNQHIE